MKIKQRSLQNINMLGMMGLALALIIAFFFQFRANEIPCPLCLLQRLGFLMMAFGLLLNVRFSLKPSHYAISALAALFTAMAALRQILLHIVPGTGVYGSALFGWHLYTWSFVVSVLFFCATFVGVLYTTQRGRVTELRASITKKLVFALGVLFVMLLLMNVISTYMECGFGFCPSDPVKYMHTL